MRGLSKVGGLLSLLVVTCPIALGQISVTPAIGQLGYNKDSLPNPGDPGTQTTFTVNGVAQSSAINYALSYGVNEPTNWLMVTPNGNKLIVGLSTDSSTWPKKQGTYSAYLTVRVGFIIRAVSIYLSVSPSDNQFRFTNLSGNDITSNVLSFSASGMQADLKVYFADQTTTAAVPFVAYFEASDGVSWLTVNPGSGKTPSANPNTTQLDPTNFDQLHLAASPNMETPSSTPYTGFLVVYNPNNPNLSGRMQLQLSVQGTPSPQPISDGGSDTFTFGLPGVYNGSNGFTVTVPSGYSQLTISGTANQNIQLYARFGTDVAVSGTGSVTADYVSAVQTNPQITISTSSSPPLTPGVWYIAVGTVSSQVTQGYVGAALTPAPATCTYSFSSSSLEVKSAAGTGSVALNTQQNCSWTATTDVSWIHIGANGQGPGPATINYSYDANTGSARGGHILAGGQQFELDQDAPTATVKIQSFGATPSSIPFGGSSTLSWSVTGATSVSIDQGIGAVQMSGSTSVMPAQTTTYHLTASDASGNTQTQSATVTVGTQPPSGLNFITATPNPILLSSGATTGMTTLSWNAPPQVKSVEIHINAPDGPTTSTGSTSGTATTGTWVNDGMVFYLQDVTGGKPLTLANTLDTVTVRAAASNATFFAASPLYIPPGQSMGTVMLMWNAPGYSGVQIRVGSSTGAAMTGVLGPSSWTFTGNWVANGETFFLQNAAGGNSSGDQNTIQKVTAAITSGGSGSQSGGGGTGGPAGNTATFYANPNPITADAGRSTGKTTLYWNQPAYSQLMILVGSPTGPPMTGILPNQGSNDTGDWVSDQMTFYLQDASSGSATGANRTVGMVTVSVNPSSTPFLLPTPAVATGAAADRLAWSSVAGASGYETETDQWSGTRWCSEEPGCTMPRIPSSALWAPAPAGTYRWRVRAIGNSEGEASAWTSWTYSGAEGRRESLEFQSKHQL